MMWLLEQAEGLSGLSPVPKGQEMLIVGRALAERKASDAAVGAFFDGGAWQEVGALFDWARTRGVRLDGVEVRPDVVSLKGSSVAWETGEDLKKKLEEWGFACELRRQGKDAGGRVPFTVEGVRL